MKVRLACALNKLVYWLLRWQVKEADKTRKRFFAMDNVLVDIDYNLRHLSR